MRDYTGRVTICHKALAPLVLFAVLQISLALGPSGVAAYPVTRLLFVGNDHIASFHLTEGISGAPENPFDRDFASRSELLLALEHAEDILRDIYKNEGYLYASVDSFHLGLTVPVDSSQGYAVTFYLTEGKRYLVDRVTLEGDSLLPRERLLQQLTLSAGEVLHEADLKADIDAMLGLYEQAGYPLARIEIAAITPFVDSSGEGKLDIDLRIHEGRRARIGKVLVTGNTSTDAAVITRELRLQSGSFYNEAEVSRARARVERLGFFESVSEPALYLENDSTVALVLAVKERATSSIDGVLGYNPPRNTTESGYISGLVDLSFRNISGTGRNASLNYSRETQTTQVLEVHYLEPWLFGYPLNLALGFSQRAQDSTYTRTASSGDLAISFTSDLSLVGDLSYERVTPTDLPDQPFSVYDSRILTTGLRADIDTRDNPIAPRYGVAGALGASYGVKSIYGPAQFIDSTTPASIGLRTLFLDASGYHSLGASRFVAALGLHARSVTAFGGTLDASDLFRLGGIYSIRGYRESELLASRYAYANAEFRVMTSHLSYLFLFVDGGYLFKDATRADSTEQVRYPLSYGFGAQVESPLGILTVSLGLPGGEPIDQAKIHFGLVKQF